MSLKLKLLTMVFFALFFMNSCNQNKRESSQSSTDKKMNFSIDYDKYTLSNGLDVVLHEDHSDPIVAVAILVHVGSNREKKGKTGFAHFFEHMLFQRSENVPTGSFMKNINKWGGTFNGGTWSDGTVYYEVVPKDALEKVFWMESDRLGYFINSVSKSSLEGEKPVVKNEKRQRYDNRPYGQTQPTILKNLYPDGHPYSWTVIGELEDLQNATLEDVKEFYEKWYGPNNATLVVVGDIKKDETKQMIEKYFGEIPAKADVEPIKPMPVTLTETKTIYHEDNFAQLPELKLTFPTVENYNKDQWALDALGQILSDGKRAPLYKSVVENTKLAPNIYSYNSSQELAGTFTIGVRANAGTSLDSVQNVIMQTLADFDKNGFDQRDLDRIKAGLETDFYGGISSVLNKAFQLATYNEFAGSPDFIEKDIANIQSVTKEDVMRVFRKYVLNKPHIVTQFVPKGQRNLANAEAQKADVKEEAITQFKPTETLEEEGEKTFEKTASKFDRSVEPEYGEKPLVTPPTIWTDKLSNGMKLYGVEMNELPLVSFSIRIKGGHYLDDKNKVGVANLLTDILQEGTANKTPEELEDAIGQLGASIGMFTGSEFTQINGECLERNFKATMDLVTEMLLEPRWDEKEYERILNQTVNQIAQRETNPNAIAQVVMNTMLYGKNHILSTPTLGTADVVKSITMDDLKAFYNKYYVPNISNFHIVGAVSQEKAKKAMAKLESNWKSKEVSFPTYDLPATPKEPQVYFVDIPNAKQSVISISRKTVASGSDKYFDISVANDRLGSGSSGRLFQVLREERGYTYGAYSFPRRSIFSSASFNARSSVRSNVTKESLDAFKEVIGNYAKTYTADDLEKTQTSLIKSNARQYETLGNIIGILQSISSYDLPLNFIDQQQKAITGATVESVKKTAEKYFNLDNLTYVIVGDKKTQFDRLKVKGAGNPIEVDKYGNKK